MKQGGTDLPDQRFLKLLLTSPIKHKSNIYERRQNASCSICRKKIPGRELIEHIFTQESHFDSGEYHCTTCTFSAMTEDVIIDHAQEHGHDGAHHLWQAEPVLYQLCNLYQNYCILCGRTNDVAGQIAAFVIGKMSDDMKKYIFPGLAEAGFDMSYAAMVGENDLYRFHTWMRSDGRVSIEQMEESMKGHDHEDVPSFLEFGDYSPLVLNSAECPTVESLWTAEGVKELLTCLSSYFLKEHQIRQVSTSVACALCEVKINKMAKDSHVMEHFPIHLYACNYCNNFDADTERSVMSHIRQQHKNKTAGVKYKLNEPKIKAEYDSLYQKCFPDKVPADFEDNDALENRNSKMLKIMGKEFSWSESTSDDYDIDLEADDLADKSSEQNLDEQIISGNDTGACAVIFEAPSVDQAVETKKILRDEQNVKLDSLLNQGGVEKFKINGIATSKPGLANKKSQQGDGSSDFLLEQDSYFVNEMVSIAGDNYQAAMAALMAGDTTEFQYNADDELVIELMQEDLWWFRGFTAENLPVLEMLDPKLEDMLKLAENDE